MSTPDGTTNTDKGFTNSSPKRDRHQVNLLEAQGRRIAGAGSRRGKHSPADVLVLVDAAGCSGPRMTTCFKDDRLRKSPNRDVCRRVCVIPGGTRSP